LFNYILYFAHLQAAIVPIILGIKSINRFKHLLNFSLIPIGFISLGFASMFEMLDHTNTDWIYINHSSLFNWLFYSFLSIGLTLLSISIVRNKFLISFNVLLCFSSISCYWLINKSSTIFFQILISIFLIINWHKKFKDYLFIAYPLFGIVLTTFFGINLVSTNNQIWHIFIGPSGSISALIFYFILDRSRKKHIQK
tara:strand:+ start:179 stop:769 length:591 start_codon:yes stop_codon:yes gene_type:complete